jgi:SnoaL-like domain
MNRLVVLALLGSMLTRWPSAVGEWRAVCDGSPQSTPLGPAAFRAVLDSVAAGWNSGRADLAANCFAASAVYVEPPDRQLYRGRAAIRDFFAESVQPVRPDRMQWHTVAFDSAGQVGFGEYTYRGRQYYHGIVVLQMDAGLIGMWREYQYASPLSREEFIAPSR